MNYQELQRILRGYRPDTNYGGETTNLSLQDVISGIQSQYTQPQSNWQGQGYKGGASQFIAPNARFQQEQFTPVAIQNPYRSNIDVKPTTSTTQNIGGVDVANIISMIDSGGYGGDGPASGVNAPSVASSSGTPGIGASTGIGGFSIGPNGMASPNSVSQAAATALGMVTGIPLGLVASINNQAANAAAQGFNMSIADTMGINANNTSNAAISANAAANGMMGVTGGAAAAAASAAAAAAAAAGHSAAAIGAASQAAADAAISGANPAAAAADAAASVDGGTTGPGSAAGIGVGSTAGINGMDAASDAASAAAADAGVAAADGVGADGPGVGSVGADAGGGGGGGGGKIICTKLHELGMMPKNIYEADQAFGKKLISESPETYYGYVRWAKHIVDLMGRDDLLGKTAVFCAYHIASPWSIAMAEEMGQPVKASWFGKFLMKRGLQFCKLVGPGKKEMVAA